MATTAAAAARRRQSGPKSTKVAGIGLTAAASVPPIEIFVSPQTQHIVYRLRDEFILERDAPKGGFTLCHSKVVCDWYVYSSHNDGAYYKVQTVSDTLPKFVTCLRAEMCLGRLSETLDRDRGVTKWDVSRAHLKCMRGPVQWIDNGSLPEMRRWEDPTTYIWYGKPLTFTLPTSRNVEDPAVAMFQADPEKKRMMAVGMMNLARRGDVACKSLLAQSRLAGRRQKPDVVIYHALETAAWEEFARRSAHETYGTFLNEISLTQANLHALAENNSQLYVPGIDTARKQLIFIASNDPDVRADCASHHYNHTSGTWKWPTPLATEPPHKTTLPDRNWRRVMRH